MKKHAHTHTHTHTRNFKNRERKEKRERERERKVVVEGGGALKDTEMNPFQNSFLPPAEGAQAGGCSLHWK